MKAFFLLFPALFFTACNLQQQSKKVVEEILVDSAAIDSLILPVIVKPYTAKDIILSKQLEFDKYTLEDEYPYKDTTRVFQWDVIKEKLAYLENSQRDKATWGVLQNYKNRNGESPLVYTFVRNEYKRVSDTLGIERYQSVPLFLPNDSVLPTRYGSDGWLVKVLSPDTLDMVRVEGVSFEGTFDVPKRYLASRGDSVYFDRVVVVDVTNQNIATLEKVDSIWFIRSMNPSTTGRHKPPYAQETPTGLFAVQEKKVKMFYTHDGSSELAGYAPYACRFSAGGYLHGVPTNNIHAAIIEYSASLGTIPRSHKCVRQATSHAKFVYEFGESKQMAVFVID